MQELKRKGHTIHGLFKDNRNLFNLWKTIKNRCQNPKRKEYKYYGGRGILLCSEWQKAENFVRWALESGYKKGLQIDRINNNGNYEPKNCHFVTCKENCNNRRNALRFVCEGKSLTAEELSQKFNISKRTIYHWNRLFGKEVAVMKCIEVLKKRKGE